MSFLTDIVSPCWFLYKIVRFATYEMPFRSGAPSTVNAMQTASYRRRKMSATISTLIENSPPLGPWNPKDFGVIRKISRHYG